MSLSVIPLKARRQNGDFDLPNEIFKILSENKISLKNGDVIVISSKYISNSQGRILDTNNIIVSEQSISISKNSKYSQSLQKSYYESQIKYLVVYQDLLLHHPIVF